MEVGWTGKWPKEGEDVNADGRRWHKTAVSGVIGPQVWKDEKKNAHSPGGLERRICLERRAWEGHRLAGNEAVLCADEKRVQMRHIEKKGWS